MKFPKPMMIPSEAKVEREQFGLRSLRTPFWLRAWQEYFPAACCAFSVASDLCGSEQGRIGRNASHYRRRTVAPSWMVG
jgi:hypothetical protein